MNSASRYSGNYIFVKGRLTAGLTTFADVGACNIALDQNGLLSTPAKVSVSSSSANDADGGTGMITATIIGLGPTAQYQEEEITLTGQTAVDSVGTWYRVFGIVGKTAGSGGTNAGDIYVVKKGTGGTYSGGVPGTFTAVSALVKAPVGAGQGLTCFYTTPDSVGSWQVTDIQISGRTQAGTACIQVQDFENETPSTREFYVDFPAGFGYQLDVRPYKITVGRKTDIRVMALGASTGLVCHAAMAIAGR